MTKISALNELATADTTDQLAVAKSTTGQNKKTLNAALVTILNKNPIQLLSQEQTVDTTNRSTTSTSLVASGVEATIDPVTLNSKIRVQVSGNVGHSSAQIMAFTLFRNVNGGGDVDITPGAVNALSWVRVDADSGVYALVIDFLDTHGGSEGDDVVYKLYWKINAAGTGYLGRRGSDTTIDSPTIMTLQEYI